MSAYGLKNLGLTLGVRHDVDTGIHQSEMEPQLGGNYLNIHCKVEVAVPSFPGRDKALSGNDHKPRYGPRDCETNIAAVK